jgi:hypothetical protein
VPSDQSTSLTIEVLPNQDELKRAIETVAGNSSEAVPEGRLRSEIVANHPTLGHLNEVPEQAVQIDEAVEKGLLNRDEEGLLRLNDSTHVMSVSETRIR